MKEKFSGYKIAACCFLIAMAVLGMGYVTLSIYVPPLIAEMQASTTAISIIFSVLAATAMVGNFVSGTVSGKIGVRGMVWVGIASLLAGYVVLYFAASVVMLYVAAALVGIGVSWAGIICIGRFVPNWFVRHQGTMLGIVMAASGIGGMIGSPIISAMIAQSGWRTACLYSTVAMAVLTIIPALFLKEKPSDVGQKALGAEDAVAAQGASVTVGPSFAVAKKSAAFFCLLLVWVAIAFLCNGFNSQITNALTLKGFDIAFCGTVVAISSAANTAGNLLLGAINDKFGTKTAFLSIMLCAIASMLCMMVCKTQGIAIAFALLFGLSQPMGATLVTLITGRVFAGQAFGQMLGINNGIVALMGIFAPLVMSMTLDMTGNYNLACIILLVVLCVAVFAGFAAFKAGDKLMKASAEN